MDDPLDSLRRSVPDWTDEQLRRAWALTGARVVIDATTAAQRGVLLAEWERRHPRESLDWDGFFTR